MCRICLLALLPNALTYAWPFPTFAVNASYIINVPTNYNMWNTTGRKIMALALERIGQDHIVAFELGNEPNACECTS